MAFKVQVGPPQICHPPGADRADHRAGRPDHLAERQGPLLPRHPLISSWAIYANGEPWDLLNGGAITYYAARIFLTNRPFLTEDGTIPARTLGLTISRSISGGMHEDLDITNNSIKPVRFNLEIALRCDFADVFEVKSSRIVRRGRIATDWSERAAAVAHDLPQPRFQPRGHDHRDAAVAARRSTPTAGSASKWRSNPARPGIAACSTRW